MSSQAAANPLATPSIFPAGTVIGKKYRIDEVIAEGGMGVVYKGWHLILEHPIAVKVVRPEYAHHAEAGARFVNEARASAQLNGIHATHVLDLGRIQNGPPVMVLEYLDGFDLRRLLSSQGPVSLGRAVDYVLQTCEAVAEAHAQGIVHRDLKPENLFITHMPDGTELLKLIDFGISKRLQSGERVLTQQSQGFGSPDYMSPEQMSTPDHVDARADIWSIGVVLFELLTNSVPFRGETVQAKCANVMCDEPIPLRNMRPDMPAQLEQVILRCLRKTPEERYSSVGELVQDLMPFASTEYEQTLARVRLLFGNTQEESPAWAPAAQALGSERARLTDATPVPPENVTRRVDLSPVRKQPSWPMSLSIGGLASAALILLAVSTPPGLQREAERAWDELPARAVRGAHELRSMALTSMDIIAAKSVDAFHNISDRIRSARGETTVTSAHPWTAMAVFSNRFPVPSSIRPPRRLHLNSASHAAATAQPLERNRSQTFTVGRHKTAGQWPAHVPDVHPSSGVPHDTDLPTVP